MTDLPSPTLYSWVNSIAAFHNVEPLQVADSLPPSSAKFVKAILGMDDQSLTKMTLREAYKGASELNSLYPFSTYDDSALRLALADHYVLALPNDYSDLLVDGEAAPGVQPSRKYFLRYLAQNSNLLFTITVAEGLAEKYLASYSHGMIVASSVCGRAKMTIPVSEGFTMRPLLTLRDE